MKTRAALLSLGAIVLVALPAIAFAATTSFFGPIVPQSGSCICATSAMDWGCVAVVFQNIINALVSVSVLAVVFFIAWGGFSLMVSGSNPAARTNAKNRLLNAALGLVLILGSWLIINTIMNVLYNPSAFGTSAPWNSILAGNANAFCITPTTPGSLTNGLATGGNIISNILNPSNAAGVSLPADAAGTACDPNALQQADPNISPIEAQTLACIAAPESTCGQNKSVAHTSGGNATSASGPFQVILGSNDTCHNLNIPACGNLTCSSAFSGGKPKTDASGNPIPLAQQCIAAANNLSCSTAAADCLVQQSVNHGGSPYAAWVSTKDGLNHTKQSTCAANGGV